MPPTKGVLGSSHSAAKLLLSDALLKWTHSLAKWPVGCDTLKRLQSESTPRDVLERTLAAAKLLLSGTPLEGRHSAAVSPVCSDTLKRLQSDSSPRGLFWGAVTLQPNGMFAASPPKRLRVSASRGEADN